MVVDHKAVEKPCTGVETSGLDALEDRLKRFDKHFTCLYGKKKHIIVVL
jgi:hypothetical protein